MNITRCGACRDCGTPTIIPDLPLRFSPSIPPLGNDVQWDTKTKQIVIKADNVSAPDEVTTHNYRIRFSLEDISALIGFLGHEAASATARHLHQHLKGQIPALVKLLACATGLAASPIADIEKPT